MTYDEMNRSINEIDAIMNRLFVAARDDQRMTDRLKRAYDNLLIELEDEEYMLGMGEQLDREKA